MSVISYQIIRQKNSLSAIGLVFVIILCIALGAYDKSYAQDPGYDPVAIDWVQDRPFGELPESLSYFTEDIDSLDQISLVKRHILESYTESGFFSGRIDSIVNSGQSLQIHTTPGERYSLSQLNIIYSDSLSDVAQYDTRFNPGQSYSSSFIESEIKNIITHYENEGFPLVTVHVVDIATHIESNTVSVNLHVVLNGHMKASGIRTSNLQRNDPHYLERASGIRGLETITPTMMRRVKRNLENTGLFDYVAEPSILVENDRNYIYVDLTEKSTNAFDLLLGYVPQQNRTNTVVGTGRVRIRNAIWQGSTLDMGFDRIQEDVSKLNLALSRDWIMDLPLGVGASYNFHQQDSSYQIRNIRLKTTWAWTNTFEISGSLRRVATSSNSNSDLPVRVLNGNSTFAGIGLHYLDVDYRGNPSRGIEFMINFETGIKQTTDNRLNLYTSNKNIRQQQASFHIRKYYNPFNRQVLAVQTNGSIIESPEFTESDMFRFGGANSIRGYREEQFMATRLIWGDIEYRYLLDRSSYAFIFGAFGMYHRPQLITELGSEYKNSGYLHAWGLGFSYATPIGFMQFSYALSPEDPLTNGKIHFGVTKDF